ncbi:MAG: hypothetical protein VX278_06455 [Myxococcota bacterium]|nr:hypothetical protein [Myxococcota bacterium]
MWHGYSILLFSCSENPSNGDESVAELRDEIEALQGTLNEISAHVQTLESTIEQLNSQSSDEEIVASYTDEDALSAIQNDDPWGNPDRANLQHLWSRTDYGYLFLENSRWTMDNRSNPAGETPRHELIQFFHETPECIQGSTFSDCNSTSALKLYVNGPRITDNNWSADGFAEAAVRNYHTHASGMYMVSFGQNSYVTDYEHGLIAPSGIHLEPHGAHQALRIDGTGNSGENIRLDISTGSKGIAIYTSPSEGLYCDELGVDCARTYPLHLRGGTVRLEDIEMERSATDARNAGVATLFTDALGIEHFYSWHTDDALGVPVHCTWNERVSSDSIVKLTPYSTSPDLSDAHSYVIVDVWGPGAAPPACTAAQSVKTNAAGVYGYSFPANFVAQGGFSVAILGIGGMALNPGDWDESDRPSFLFEVLDPI